MVDTVKILLEVLILKRIDFVPQFFFETFLLELLPKTADFIFDFSLFELDEAYLVSVFQLSHLSLIFGDDLGERLVTLSFMLIWLRWMSFWTMRWVCMTVWFIY